MRSESAATGEFLSVFLQTLADESASADVATRVLEQFRGPQKLLERLYYEGIKSGVGGVSVADPATAQMMTGTTGSSATSVNVLKVAQALLAYR